MAAVSQTRNFVPGYSRSSLRDAWRWTFRSAPGVCHCSVSSAFVVALVVGWITGDTAVAHEGSPSSVPLGEGEVRGAVPTLQEVRRPAWHPAHGGSIAGMLVAHEEEPCDSK